MSPKQPPLADFQIDKLAELKAMTFAAMVMAAVDEYIDDEEMDLINEFVQYHWKPAFGDRQAFMLEMDRRLADFLFPEGNDLEYATYRQKFIEEVLPELKDIHCQELVRLMTLVMDADEIREKEELSLIQTLKDQLLG